MAVITQLFLGIESLSEIKEISDLSSDTKIDGLEKTYKIGTKILFVLGTSTYILADYIPGLKQYKIAALIIGNGVALLKDLASMPPDSSIEERVAQTGSILIRISQTVLGLSILNEEKLDLFSKKVKIAFDATNGLGLILNNHQTINSFLQLIHNAPKSDIGSIVFYLNRVQQEEFKYLNSIEDASELHKIPARFQFDRIFQKYICPITKYPIRYAAVVKGTEKSGSPVFYEKENLFALLDKGDEKPPKWPLERAFKKKNILESKEIQSEIDNHLNELIINFKSQHFIPKIHYLFEISEELKLLDKDIDDAALIDKIIERLPHRNILSVSVDRLMMHFENEDDKTFAKMITFSVLKPFVCTSKNKDFAIELSAKALMGSKDEIDLKSLDEFLDFGYRELVLIISSQNFQITARK